MKEKCPGSNRIISSELITCPYCNTEVELFSDEIQRLCPGCRKIIFHEALPGCISWCSHAKECMDISRWLAYQKKGNKEPV
ncbi:MAG: hypothetical protein JXB88_13235 [Spirochaetales bacterium]|nr:hypothetical protein [Spirochaetales bacterium]